MRPLRLAALAGLALAFAAAAPAALAAPTAFWRLDEADGTTAFDATGHGFDGAYAGATLGAPGAPVDPADGAAYFHGGGGVTVPYSAALNSSTYTVEAWVKTDTLPPYLDLGTNALPIVCSRNADGTQGYMLYLDDYVGHPQFAFVVGAGSSRRYVYDSSSPAVQTGQWYHVAGSFDGTNLHVYVNGTEVTGPQLNDGDGTSIQPNPGSPLQLGGCPVGPTGYTGSIDEAAVYSVALSGTDIGLHYQSGIPGPPDGWPGQHGGSGGSGGHGGGGNVPLIFVPGIQGSRLACAGVELWPQASLWFDPWDFWLRALELRSAGSAESTCPAPLSAPDIIRTAVADGVHTVHAYDATIDQLTQAGYEEGRDLFVFPFDWRRSASSSAAALAAEIDSVRSQTGAPKVDILAHSQGGLVTRVALTLPESVGKVRRVLTMGTPVLGAGKLLGVLVYGTPCLVEQFGTCLLNRNTVREVVQTLPGAYDLLPSRAYFSAVGPPLGVNGTALTYDGFLSVVRAKSDPELVRAAQQRHDTYDVASPADSNVLFTRLAGTRLGTIGRIDEENTTSACIGCAPLHWVAITYVDGDGTVPRGSAAQGSPQAFVAGVKHAELPTTGCVMQYAIAYFQQQTPPGSAGCVFGRATARRSLAATDSFDGYQLSVDGPAQGLVSDATGNALGPDPRFGDPNAVAEEIPGGDYEAMGDSQSYFVNGTGSFVGRLHVSAAGSLRIRVEHYGAGALDEVATYVFPHVAPGEQLSVPFGDAPRSGGTVGVDANGDGTQDSTAAPDAVAAGDAAGDLTPPATSAGFAASGLVRATVTLEGDDGAGGSGIAAIYYSVDGGPQQLYAGPFAVRLYSTVEYRSVDRAGNLGPVERLVVDDAPNDRAHAEPIAPRAELIRAIAPRGDEDWYRFRADGVSTYRAQLEGLTNDCDLELYGADGTLLQAPARRSSASEEVRGRLPAGTYYLRVVGVAGAFGPMHPYRLKLQTLGR